MKTITVHRAGDFPKATSTGVEICHIKIEPSIEGVLRIGGSLEESARVYQRDAEQIAAALFEHLPQGTQERVLIELMRRRVSGFAGPSCR